MCFSKGLLLAEIFEIQILGFFNRIGPNRTLVVYAANGGVEPKQT